MNAPLSNERKAMEEAHEVRRKAIEKRERELQINTAREKSPDVERRRETRHAFSDQHRTSFHF